MKGLITNILVILLTFNILGFVMGITIYKPCMKISTPVSVWNYTSNTKPERLFIKPMAILMSPGVYIGATLVVPSRCK